MENSDLALFADGFGQLMTGGLTSGNIVRADIGQASAVWRIGVPGQDWNTRIEAALIAASTVAGSFGETAITAGLRAMTDSKMATCFAASAVSGPRNFSLDTHFS